MSDEQRQHEQVQVTQSEQPNKPRPAWGDPLDSIPSVRQDELRALAGRQREWAAQDTPDLKQSVFNDVRLTGAEIFFLAAYALAGPESTGDDIEQAAAGLRDPHNPLDLDLSTLHLETLYVNPSRNSTLTSPPTLLYHPQWI